jgi:hypothetical protein
MRSFSQIGARVGYFLVLSDYPPGEGAVSYAEDSTLAFPNYPGAYIIDGSLSILQYPPLTQGELLKDLGRQVTIVNNDGVHLAVFREVQRVNGATTEGVGGPGSSDDGLYGTLYVNV